MTLDVRNVILDVDDLEAGETFWTAALGYERTMGEAGLWCALVDPEGHGVPVGLQIREDAEPDATVNRVHLDLMADDVDAEVERLEGLGAEPVEDWPYPSEATFVVMRDPSANEFCVTERVEIYRA